MKRCGHCKAPGRLLKAGYAAHEVRIGNRTFTGHLRATRCGRCRLAFIHATELERFELIVAERLARAGVASGEAFRFMRKSLGLRAADLAAQIGMTPETVSRWEKGRRKVDVAAWVVLGRLVVDRVQGRDDSQRLLAAIQAPAKLAKVIHIEGVRGKRVRGPHQAHAAKSTRGGRQPAVA
jgi:DNA-binding transcriptional regulator YiaG